MTIVEKAAYLKGLAEGLGVGAETGEGKLWSALTDLLGDMAHEIEDLQASNLDLSDVIDELGEELSAVEETVYDLDSPELFDPEFDEDEDEDEDVEDEDEPDEEEDEDGDDEEAEEDEEAELVELPRFDGVMYDVTCPVCGTEITLDEEMLAEGSIDCPGCGETLEFDLQDEDGES
ncbi:MAG: hypothetical protein IJJ43_04030 [Oscillospiraceae bacterium]|nr:hypothetical protein [Oscillospiraceae bacterium]